MLYILAWLTILFCFFASFLAIGTWISARYPESKFQNWWKENIIDSVEEEDI